MVRMANLLKHIFSTTEPTIEGVLRFDSAESKKEFLNTGLKKIEQGKSSTITGLEKLFTLAQRPGNTCLTRIPIFLILLFFHRIVSLFTYQLILVITIIFCVERITIILSLFAMLIKLFHMLK